MNDNKMLYFAYGSNLNIMQMKHRCPTAKYMGPTYIDNYGLVFKYFADIEPDPGNFVPGGLWEITPSDELALDRYEGVESGLYTKEYFKLKGRLVLWYKMANESYCPPGKFYLETIEQGYRDFHLPYAYLAEAVGTTYSKVNLLEDFTEGEWWDYPHRDDEPKDPDYAEWIPPTVEASPEEDPNTPFFVNDRKFN